MSFLVYIVELLRGSLLIMINLNRVFWKEFFFFVWIIKMEFFRQSFLVFVEVGIEIFFYNYRVVGEILDFYFMG